MLVKTEIANQLDSLGLAVVVFPEASGETLLVAIGELLQSLLDVEVLKVAEVHQSLEINLGLVYWMDLLDKSLGRHAEEGSQGSNP